MMRVLVCGGRDYGNRDLVYETLDQFHTERPITLLIQGGATGADALAKDWANSRNIALQEFVADWDNLDVPVLLMKFRRGKAYNALAGIERNKRMLAEGVPDVVIKFPGGRGTFDMLCRAYTLKRTTRKELQVIEVDDGWK